MYETNIKADDISVPTLGERKELVCEKVVLYDKLNLTSS